MPQTTKPTKHAEMREGVQPHAGIPYTFDQIDTCLETFAKVGRELGVI